MTYDLTPYTNSSNLIELALATNTTLGGHFFGHFVLLVVFLVAFLGLKSKGMFTPESFSIASWCVMIIAIMLRPMELIPNSTFWLSIILVPLATGALYLAGTGD